MLTILEIARKASEIHKVVDGISPEDFNNVCQVVFWQLSQGIRYQDIVMEPEDGAVQTELALVEEDEEVEETEAEEVVEEKPKKKKSNIETADEEEVEYNRKAIKEELDRLKIAYSTKSKTTTLYNLLEKHKKLAAEEPKEDVVEEAKEEIEAFDDIVSVEEAREVLIKFVSKYNEKEPGLGSAKGKKIMSEFGGARLSDLSDKDRTAMIHAIVSGKYEEA